MNKAVETEGGPRLDKWLWAARFFKTRALAAEAIDKGRVLSGGQPIKRSREVRVGDRLSVRQGAPGELPREIEVLALSAVRGPAPVAQQLYAETAQSLAAREAAAKARKLAPEPALAIEHGRPTKRDRRELHEWQRWSASVDDKG
ncbi:RNA-binding S4 domain-containing protein [Rivibacter subsaxonicus]|uniref:Heat shock protein Hsp15 n=1 Tax=Rivibacter subsaxonicus TaxID=457575 RepID=A0A4Q7W014_9BURK|nr:RNA-binding S4 domain-containing protein [Rivibacter subsaxonicus]RZU02532.1 heat shock protein Hsp15 [Rivibacter subsaxonicus]